MGNATIKQQTESSSLMPCFTIPAAGIASSFFFIESGSKGYLLIPKSSITNTEVKKSFLNKSVALTLDDGQVHTFSYGAMNIDKVVDAINLR